ncbi:hypothetical protein DH2020_028371 [Rehmannia glutinosa]|uniref:Uncharacterized protein n=1 Tax=Rehmannia glutinosa TaxID=99300 RepID=A0ABR0VSJ3_REHGL
MHLDCVDVGSSTYVGVFEILMFPWIAHGHISPFMRASKNLSRRQRFPLCYICSTPVILNSIKNKIHENTAFHPSSISSPHIVELPPHYHTTNGLPLDLHPISAGRQNGETDFLQPRKISPPNLLIHDIFRDGSAEEDLKDDILHSFMS